MEWFFDENFFIFAWGAFHVVRPVAAAMLTIQYWTSSIVNNITIVNMIWQKQVSDSSSMQRFINHTSGCSDLKAFDINASHVSLWFWTDYILFLKFQTVLSQVEPMVDHETREKSKKLVSTSLISMAIFLYC